MSEKKRFSMLLRPDERVALRRLAKLFDRSEGAMVRQLIRLSAQEHGLWPNVYNEAVRIQGENDAML